MHPSWVLVGFFSFLMAIGTVLLSLSVSATGSEAISPLNALFTAVSAATGTGLTVVDTATFWSPFGQTVLFLLFQVGGLFSLVASTLFLLFIARRIVPEERLTFQRFIGVQTARGVFILTLGIGLYALAVEAIGAYFLYSDFSASMPKGEAWWQAIFHASSSFNNAGFALLDLGHLRPSAGVQATLISLTLLGWISFLIIADIVRGLFRRALSLDTKLALTASVLLLLGGAGLMLLLEGDRGESFGDLSWRQKLLATLFHSAMARTAGLTATDLAGFTQATLLLVIALMFIGGGGGRFHRRWN